LLLLSVLSSCRLLRPSIMLKTPRGYAYDKVTDSMSVEDYKISSTDHVSFRILSNDGFKLVDVTQNTNSLGNTTVDVTVDMDGTVKLPLVGRVNLSGMTTREAEQLLETRYAEFYVGPYVTVRVTNKRVTIFPGTGGSARVVRLTDNNTTLIEALALANGIQEDGKAYKIKLIRQAKPKPKVYLIDLSTIDGLSDGNIVVQANDIVYVEPRDRVARRLAGEIVPYITLLSTFILVYGIFTR
jgi:polysaccharide biosynthesis/export protein